MRRPVYAYSFLPISTIHDEQQQMRMGALTSTLCTRNNEPDQEEGVIARSFFDTNQPPTLKSYSWEAKNLKTDRQSNPFIYIFFKYRT